MKALVVIDVQKAMFEMPGFVPLDGEAVVCDALAIRAA